MTFVCNSQRNRSPHISQTSIPKAALVKKGEECLPGVQLSELEAMYRYASTATILRKTADQCYCPPCGSPVSNHAEIRYMTTRVQWAAGCASCAAPYAFQSETHYAGTPLLPFGTVGRLVSSSSQSGPRYSQGTARVLTAKSREEWRVF